jgi:hypothetical protein
MRRNVAKLVILLSAWSALVTTPQPIRAGTPSEYDIKAAFLYNFAKFVDWPDKAFANSGSPVVIGVLGDDPFGDALDQITRGKTANGRRVEIKHFDKARDCVNCHILFVSSSEKRRLAKIFDAIGDASVLTVGDVPRFAEDGGVVNLTMDKNRVNIEVNVQAARRAHLKISSKLLNLAKIIKE